MKGIILAVAAVLLSAVNASAYSHSFTNNTPAPVRFWVNYAMCSNDSWEPVKPGETITWRSGLCCMKPPSVKLLDKNAQFNGSAQWNPEWIASTYAGTFGFNFEPISCMNTNWKFVKEDGKMPKLVQY